MRIHDYLLRVTRDPAAAEDLTQDTFVSAFENRQSLRDPCRFRAWLFSIAHNLAMRHLGRQARGEELDERADRQSSLVIGGLEPDPPASAKMRRLATLRQRGRPEAPLPGPGTQGRG